MHTPHGQEILKNFLYEVAGAPPTWTPAAVIEEQVEQNIGPLVDEWHVNWVWMPPWGMERITEDGRDQMRALGFNI